MFNPIKNRLENVIVITSVTMIMITAFTSITIIMMTKNHNKH
jgi:hypothetical protein